MVQRASHRLSYCKQFLLLASNTGLQKLDKAVHCIIKFESQDWALQMELDNIAYPTVRLVSGSGHIHWSLRLCFDLGKRRRIPCRSNLTLALKEQGASKFFWVINLMEPLAARRIPCFYSRVGIFLSFDWVRVLPVQLAKLSFSVDSTQSFWENPQNPDQSERNYRSRVEFGQSKRLNSLVGCLNNKYICWDYGNRRASIKEET